MIFPWFSNDFPIFSHPKSPKNGPQKTHLSQVALGRRGVVAYRTFLEPQALN